MNNLYCHFFFGSSSQKRFDVYKIVVVDLCFYIWMNSLDDDVWIFRSFFVELSSDYFAALVKNENLK